MSPKWMSVIGSVLGTVFRSLDTAKVSKGKSGLIIAGVGVLGRLFGWDFGLDPNPDTANAVIAFGTMLAGFGFHDLGARVAKAGAAPYLTKK